MFKKGPGSKASFYPEIIAQETTQILNHDSSDLIFGAFLPRGGEAGGQGSLGQQEAGAGGASAAATDLPPPGPQPPSQWGWWQRRRCQYHLKQVNILKKQPQLRTESKGDRELNYFT